MGFSSDLIINTYVDDDFLEKLIWYYICSTKSKYLINKISIKWVNYTFFKSMDFIPNYSAEYCHKGFLKKDRHKIFNYYGAIKNLHLEPVKYFVSKEDFFAHIEDSSKVFNSNKALYLLRFIDHSFSARSYDFYKYAIGFIILICTCCTYFFDLCLIASSFISFLHNILNIYLLSLNKNITTYFLPISFFPIYTILIPLYIEPHKLNFMVNAISRLHYPKNKLDVKLVLEEDDYITHKALSLIELPNYFQVIKVPCSHPRTKPKALNYAIQYASGDYVAIFDAEDCPAQDQLIKSLQVFNKMGQQYICLQAALNFYNRNENLLTKMQSLEYTIWFDYLLQGLCQLKHFIPLGGTSCHFRLAELRKVGFWDPFNVTEDLDLGIRIYLKGYRVCMLDSVTLEEAVLSVFAWLRQRSRWIKGFMQSYIVFCSNKKKFNLSFKQKIVIDIFVGFSVMHFLIPLYIFSFYSFENSYIINCILYLNFGIGIIYLVCVAVIALIKQNLGAKSLNFKDLAAIFTFLFYFVLHTIAAYIALLELISSPFKWNKTRHGVSKIPRAL